MLVASERLLISERVATRTATRTSTVRAKKHSLQYSYRTSHMRLLCNFERELLDRSSLMTQL